MMNIVCVPTGLIDLEHPQKGIETISESGFDSILFDMAACCPPDELEKMGKPGGRIDDSRYPAGLAESIAPLLKQCLERKMHISIVRAPRLFRNTKRCDLTDVLSDLAKECIKICARAGCRQLIVSPVFAGVPHGTEWDVNRKYYLGLVNIARENDVTILLESQFRDMNGHLIRGICMDVNETAAWIDRLNRDAGEERFGFCMDIGVCTICGQGVQELTMTLNSRIKAVILRDCDGQHDTSMLPFTCINYGHLQTDWTGLILGLRENCYDGSLIIDFGSNTMTYSHLLRPQMLRMAKMTADYFRWQIAIKAVIKKYDKRVLFGAGNMCRNYMKCYGREFPPLFTCDNDENRWGGQIEGLEIRPPEALRELEQDCVIFICNIYYGEIEKQLRQMKIRNPVAYFSDEYMPPRYFNGIEGKSVTKND